jgi:hypothetical protein
MKNTEIDLVQPNESSEVSKLIQSRILEIRPEMQSNSYIEEALRVLPVQGYRSAIGSIWNAVIDDLRNKVMHRSLYFLIKKWDKD